MKKPAIAAIALVSLAVIGVIFVVSHLSRDRYQNSQRREWKNNSIREIESDSGNTAGLLPTDGEWLSDRMIIFEDGSSMLYRQKCHKEDRRIHDIFIGRSAEGKWYYSTFHFCIGAIVLRADDQPTSIDAFVANYFLKEFDGKSDNALLATWPPHEAEQGKDGQTAAALSKP